MSNSAAPSAPVVGTCSECGQELLLTPTDCWHPHHVERACPPEVPAPTYGVAWGESYGRPGRDKFVPATNAPESPALCPTCRHWLDTNHGARGCYECDCEVVGNAKDRR